jgi:type IX secretion system PorP/SprF family membrane protein
MKKIFLSAMFVFIVLALKAQDGQLSYVYASPLAVNPASTGSITEGKLRVVTSFRKQWSGFIDKGIVNYSFSIDAPFKSKKAALGAIFFNNSATGGAVKNISAALSFGYNTYVDRSAKIKLAFGLQAGFGQKSFDPSKLTFDNQYVPGVGFDPALDSREEFSHTTVTYPDFSFGTLLYYEVKSMRKVFPWVGVAAYHLTEPNESFYKSVNSKLPRKYILSAGAVIRSSETFAFIPHVMMVNQAGVTQLNIGSTFNMDFNKFTSLIFGAYYRTKDAGIVMLGIDYDKFTLQMVYDINTSTLSPVTRGFGGYEVTLKYQMMNERRYKFF